MSGAPTFAEMMAAIESSAAHEPIHVRWVALPTKQHLDGDDCDQLGTGPDGWGLYEEDDEEGYFGWFHHKAEAEFVVEQHNAAVDAIEKLEELREEIGRLPLHVSTLGGYIASDAPFAVVADEFPGAAEAVTRAAAERERKRLAALVPLEVVR